MDEFDHFFLSPSNFDRTLSFYADVLGWEITSSWGQRGSGRGAMLKSGRMQAVIAEKHSDDPTDSSNRAINGERPTMYVAVDDLEAKFAGLRDRSAVVIPPEMTHWGIKWFVMRDPDGNLIAFTQRT
jgi:predicted enzyme related to lactoylglutathione lyase